MFTNKNFQFDQAVIRRVLEAKATKSDKIRELNRLGLPRADIARALGIRYQFVRNVLVNDGRRAGGPLKPEEDALAARLTRGLPTKAAKIRALDAAGFSRSRIADAMGVRYQQVRNALVNAAADTASSVRDASSDIPVRPAASDPAGPVAVMLQPGGKVPLPRAFTEVLGVSEGDELLLCLEGDELRLYSRATAIEQVQARVRRRLPEGVSLADELIAERRRENRREAAGHG